MLRLLTRVASFPLSHRATPAPVTSIRLLSGAAEENSQPPPNQPISSTQQNEPVVRTVAIPKTKRPRPSPEPSPKAATSNHRPLPSEPYIITRTRTGHFPVYKVIKGSGTLIQTRIRRIDGDLEALRGQLEQYLQPTPKKVEVNELTRHVLVKGDYRTKVEAFLAAKGF